MKDITGQRFGHLTALSRTDRKSGTCYLWLCRCDCGKDVEVSLHGLTSGKTRSCGCLQAEAWRRDLTGQRFGRLVALENTGRMDEKTACYLWRCRCDCGNTVEVPVTALTHGTRKSCGCLNRQNRKLTAGEKRGSVTAVSPLRLDGNGRTVWRWHCDCGNTFEKTSGPWWSGPNPMCPECNRKSRHRKAVNMLEKTERYEPTGAALGMAEDIRNGELVRNNTSGIRGVSWNRALKMWVAYIQVNHQRKVIGYFKDKEEAGRARAEAVKEIYG